MKTLSEWLDLVADMDCPFIQYSMEELELGFSEKSLDVLERILDVLELHEEEIRRHRQKIQLILSEYLMKKYHYDKTRDKDLEP